MPYSKDTYQKALSILEKRHDKAELDATLRAEKIRAEIPEVDEIQLELSKIGLELSRLIAFKNDVENSFETLKARSKALVARRSQILMEHGLSPDEMKPRYTCLQCEDKGFIDGRMCTCHKEILKELSRQSIAKFAPIYRCTFDSFSLDNYSTQPDENSIVPRERAKAILESARRYAQNFSISSKSLLFMGGTGLGKTHLSLAIANVAINRGYSVCYGTSQNICDDLRSEMFGRYEGLTYSKDAVLETDLLILDDLGTEIENQYSSASIYNIINSRILSGKPTIISTNYDFGELYEKYDQRITSRINGVYTTMTFVGKDIRNIL